MRHGTAIFVLAIALPAAGGALAADPDRGEATAALETVVVVGKREQPVTRAAARVTVIDAEALARTLSRDIRDAVRYEPGITVPSDPIRFGVGSFAIRGIGGNRVASEIDGVPVPDAFGIGSFASSGRSFVALEFVDRIEVLRGPASALYGSDAIAGIVAFETLDPTDLTGERFVAAVAHGDYSSVDRSRGATGVLAARADGLEALLGVAHRAGHARDIAGAIEPNPREYDSTSALGKLLWPQAPGGRVEFAAMADRAATLTDVQALLGQPGRFSDTVGMDADDSSDRLRLSLEQQLAVSRGPESATWRFYWQQSRVRQDTHEERKAAPPRVPEPVAIDRRFDLVTRQWGGEATATSRWRTGDWQHELVYGLEGDFTTIDEVRSAMLTNAATGATTRTVLGEEFPLRDFPRTRVRELGLFVQDEVRSAADRWSLIPALRIDHYDLKPLPDPRYLEAHPVGSTVGTETWSVSPKLGIVRRFDTGFSVFAQYARGFRPPPFSDVNVGLEIPLLNLRAIPNPDLEPETSDGFEVGVRAQRQGWTLDASAYHTLFDDFIDSRVNLGRDPQSGLVLFQSRNVADALVYGIEASIASSIYRRPPGWSWRGSVSWARGEDRSTGAELQAIEPAKLVLATAYGARSGRWSAEAVLTAVDRKRGLDRNREDLFVPGGYVTLDLYGHLELSDHLSLDVGLVNATDARYTPWADVTGRSAADPLLPMYRQPGRSITVRLTWRP
ncbi:MAG TPA: TonB-dependent hemoglobin/transferrin/lactoferrin family receptor [Steroidobacteraceae bacterium]|nr:TonB-dependent hemoglobin/transferrin/lactoferrin family receptor [Steroidobacteraceae bacterium]